MGGARSTLRYRTQRNSDDALRLALIRPAKHYRHSGYRKVGELLRAEGWRVNHKKVERLWRQEGLRLPHRRKKRKRLTYHDASVIGLRPKYANQIWSVDLVHDRPSNGRWYTMLAVLDEFTREVLCVRVATKMRAEEALEALYPLMIQRGTPTYLRSDNGEFIAEPLQTWLRKVSVEPIRIFLGLPSETAYNERFYGTLRREVLNAEWFASTRQAQVVLDVWRRQYNRVCPISAGYATACSPNRD